MTKYQLFRIVNTLRDAKLDTVTARASEKDIRALLELICMNPESDSELLDYAREVKAYLAA